MTSDVITAALVRRLRTSDAISDEDVQVIRRLPVTVKDYPAGRPVVRDGQRATECCLIVEGFCFRSKTIADGKRQILSIHISGEIPDLMSLFLHVMDHDLSTLTACRLGFIRHETLQDLHRRRPAVAEMFWRDTLIDAAMFRPERPEVLGAGLKSSEKERSAHAGRARELPRVHDSRRDPVTPTLSP